MADAVQLGFDSQIFGGNFSCKVPKNLSPIENFSRRDNRPFRATRYDPFALHALRAERRICGGLRRPFSDFSKAAAAVSGVPDQSLVRCFAYVVISAYAVAQFYYLTPDEMFSGKREEQEFGGARHLCRYLAKTYGGFSTVEVGRVVSRHHSTILHSVELVGDLRLATPQVETDLRHLEEDVLDLWALAGGGEGVTERLALVTGGQGC